MKPKPSNKQRKAPIATPRAAPVLTLGPTPIPTPLSIISVRKAGEPKAPKANVVLQVEWESRHFLKSRVDRRIEACTMISVDDGIVMTLCEHFGNNIDLMLLTWKNLSRVDHAKFAAEAAAIAETHAFAAVNLLKTFASSNPEAMYMVRAAELYTNNIRTIADLLELLLEGGEVKPNGGITYVRVVLDRSIAGMIKLKRQSPEDFHDFVEVREPDGVAAHYDSGGKGEVSLNLLAQALRISPDAMALKLEEAFSELRQRPDLKAE